MKRKIRKGGTNRTIGRGKRRASGRRKAMRTNRKMGKTNRRQTNRRQKNRRQTNRRQKGGLMSGWDQKASCWIATEVLDSVKLYDFFGAYYNPFDIMAFLCHGAPEIFDKKPKGRDGKENSTSFVGLNASNKNSIINVAQEALNALIEEWLQCKEVSR